MSKHLVTAAAKWLFPFFLITGVFFLFRGHNEPGGGFIGGLVFASAFVIKYLGNPIHPSSFRIWQWTPEQVTAMGLLIGASSGLLALFFGQAYMTGVWHFELWLPLVGKTKFGTPFYFDIGVFLVVIGVVTKIFLSLEAERWKSS